MDAPTLAKCNELRRRVEQGDDGAAYELLAIWWAIRQMAVGEVNHTKKQALMNDADIIKAIILKT